MQSKTSEKQIKANKVNAKLGGVKTSAGIEISKYNAQKHGILGQTLTEYEQTSYRGIFEELRAYYKPKGIIEDILVERMAIHHIKLYRIAQAENEFIKSVLNPTLDIADEMDRHLIRKRGYEPTVKSSSVEKLQNIYSRYEATIENRLYKTMHELERIQRMRKGEKVSAPVAVDVGIDKMGSFGEN